MNKKYKVGYTSGVFDLFHIGHLNILKQAKNRCEKLIVAVTTDELVLSRKSHLPVVPFDERVEILRHIDFVDEVVSQPTMDKLSAWDKYRFDVMFVGDDWKGSKAWNEYEDQLAKVGVPIIYFPYTKTTSSTILRKVLDEIIENKNNNKQALDSTNSK